MLAIRFPQFSNPCLFGIMHALPILPSLLRKIGGQLLMAFIHRDRHHPAPTF